MDNNTAREIARTRFPYHTNLITDDTQVIEVDTNRIGYIPFPDLSQDKLATLPPIELLKLMMYQQMPYQPKSEPVHLSPVRYGDGQSCQIGYSVISDAVVVNWHDWLNAI